MKICSKCGEVKDKTEFNKCSSKKDGLQGKCRACWREYNRNYRKDNKERIADYRKNNKERINR